MYELLKAIQSKYKIFLITRVDSNDSHMHQRAKESLNILIDEGIINQHRSMYCTTEVG